MLGNESNYASIFDITYQRFTPQARAILLAEFEVNPYPDRRRKEQLSDQIARGYTSVTVWFENERKRRRRLGEKLPSGIKEGAIFPNAHYQQPTLESTAVTTSSITPVETTEQVNASISRAQENEVANILSSLATTTNSLPSQSSSGSLDVDCTSMSQAAASSISMQIGSLTEAPSVVLNMPFFSPHNLRRSNYDQELVNKLSMTLPAPK